MSATSNKQTNPTAEGHRVQISLNQLNDDVATLVAENTAHLAKITDLQKEVNVYKRAYDDLDNKHKALENITAELERKNEDLETRLKGSRVVILIDGDGSIFRKELLYQGTKGGLSAARQLSDHLTQFLTSNYGSRQYKLWVYIFLNKGGLMQSLKQGGHPQCAKKLEQFMAGFNQAAERFSMIDVGWAKEAADAKIKTYLEDEVRTSQTFKIIFGGCHDNGYVNNLRSQITAGYRDKLVLLKTYTEMAMGISELGLPTMSVTELFMTEKLRITFTPDIGHSRSNSIPATPMIHRDSDTLSVTSEQAFSDMGLYSPQKALLDLPGPSGSNDKSFTLSACSPLQADNLNLEPLKPRQLDPKIVEYSCPFLQFSQVF
ncbi:hypothetical protein D9758_000905 [Tetrapyrgos nigripes]|uniref:DUF7923 domain-containing protein n=1 Tax=Tetrapyrgos nigripes TaxID=182062 RepID=A0A8H5GZ06_9AGAR|nr:hypothetical protein D9758_000905 [Tetrapyrgos nigripes]